MPKEIIVFLKRDNLTRLPPLKFKRRKQGRLSELACFVFDGKKDIRLLPVKTNKERKGPFFWTAVYFIRRYAAVYTPTVFKKN